MEIYEADSFNGTQSRVSRLGFDEDSDYLGIVFSYINEKFELQLNPLNQVNPEVEEKCVKEINSIARTIDLLEQVHSKTNDESVKDLLDLYIFTSIKMIQHASDHYDRAYHRNNENDLERTVFSEKYSHLVDASFDNFVTINFKKVIPNLKIVE